MLSDQAIEMLGRVKLNEQLSEKGKAMIWQVIKKDYRQFKDKVVLTWEAQHSQVPIFKVQTTVDLTN